MKHKLLMTLIGITVGFTAIVWTMTVSNRVVARHYDAMLAHLTKQQQKDKRSLSQATNRAQPLVTQTKSAFDNLFGIDWTYDNQSEFDNKRSLMKPLVTQDVYDHSLDFKKDKNQMVKQSGIMVAYQEMALMPDKVSDTNVTGTVVVFLTTHLEGKDEGTIRFVYHFAYNPKTKLITKLDRLGNYELQSDSDIA
mgnify:CR=1 FL=1